VLDSAVNLLRRDDSFFDQPMRDPCRHGSVEEVQDPVVNGLKADPEFVNSIAQKIRSGRRNPWPTSRNRSNRTKHLS
jgi:hypothetical protein